MIVLWRLTKLCNLACGFCAYDRRVPQPRVQSLPAEVERLAALFGAYRESVGQPVLLSWLGGEPMLWPGVLDLSGRLKRQFGLRTSITTNGTRSWQPSSAQALSESFDEITFSVDALETTHERLRGWPGGMARLAEGIQRLANLRRPGSGPLLRANVVLMRDTLPEFAELCMRLADWGIQEITFNQLGGRDRPDFHRAQALGLPDISRLRELLPPLVAALADRGVRLHADTSYVARLEATAAGRPVAVTECEARRPTIFIDEFARIAACSFTLDSHSLSSDSVRTISDIAELRDRLAARRRSAPAAVCNDCPSTQVFAKFGT
ncbi:radical SAM protein [Pseudoxanthomonas daejeonensis]|uniref:Radical SAM core domain-containing protein n=1 Tax=Pseudoxanthomonas daejeonensis TaxID=266062 RepID=A0ABQ6Z7A7_9GAMM|nr:radical SAM protein [Pseudoxanthomonas daejeonensis]KAF1694713.1 hypothetical protein CSC65_08435 [Pseudoxanthomonas daejeonensis]